jgi:hypothetical protein
LLQLPCAEANLLFGRGMLAGIDRREQKKVAATVEVSLAEGGVSVGCMTLCYNNIDG